MPIISPVGAISVFPIVPVAPSGSSIAAANSGGFEQLIMRGLAQVDAKVTTADNLVGRVALGENVAVHRVTLALEEARIAVEFASQIRTRLVETWRDFMTMQV